MKEGQLQFDLEQHQITRPLFPIVERRAFVPSQNHPEISQAEAAANQFRITYCNSGLPSGRLFLESNAHPTLAHHGDHHTRHYEKALKKVIKEAMKIDQLATIFEGSFGRNLMHALMLTVHFHDADQLFGEFRNLSLPNNEHLKVKKGHAIAAAVQIMAMSDLYAESLSISCEEAIEITSLTAIMMMRHDEPGTVSQALSPENRDASDIQDQKELVKRYQSDTLHLSTLSPAQMIRILKYLKENAGFIGRDGSIFGLSPAFEKDFEQQLIKMQQDNNPIFQLTIEDQLKLKACTEMAVWADLADMVSPYWEAIFRTFQSHPSRDRPFGWTHADVNGINYPPNAEKLFSHVLDPKNGNGKPNDLERLLWELYNIDGFAHKTVLNKIPFVRDFNKEHAILGTLALRKIAEAMYVTENIKEIIELVYGRRIRALNQTAKNQGNSLHTSRYWDTVDNLDREAGEMRKLLKYKISVNEEDYKYFELVYQMFCTALCSKFYLNLDEFNKFSEIVESGDPASTQSQLFTTDRLYPANASIVVLNPEYLQQ